MEQFVAKAGMCGELTAQLHEDARESYAKRGSLEPVDLGKLGVGASFEVMAHQEPLLDGGESLHGAGQPPGQVDGVGLFPRLGGVIGWFGVLGWKGCDGRRRLARGSELRAHDVDGTSMGQQPDKGPEFIERMDAINACCGVLDGHHGDVLGIRRRHAGQPTAGDVVGVGPQEIEGAVPRGRVAALQELEFGNRHRATLGSGHGAIKGGCGASGRAGVPTCFGFSPAGRTGKAGAVSKSDDALWRKLGSRRRLFLLSGPCAIESEALCLEVGRRLRDACRRAGIDYVFKASFDKANRSSGRSYRGPGMDEGLAILGRVREALRVPVMTDVHTAGQCEAVGRVCDVLQIPAFLCRQTDLVAAAVATGRLVNIKKGQFLAPGDMAQVVAKAREAGGGRLLLTERGTTFGYNNLVADMRSIPIMRRNGVPVVFDATHSVQLPGGQGDRSGGQREFAPVLAAAAVAAGCDGLFIETHPDPDHALSDGPNMVPLDEMPALIRRWVGIWKAAR